MTRKPMKDVKRKQYSAELRADLLRHFEAGKGHISQNGKAEIREKHGLTNHKIVCWANDRRRRHGIYDERKFFNKLLKFITDFPNSPPSSDLQRESQKLLDNIAKIEGWTTTENEASASENAKEV